jgi:SAM-dependent methyltransferase
MDRYRDGCYLAMHPTWHMEDSLWKAEQILRLTPSEVWASPLRLAEIGCGAGGVLAHLWRLLQARSTDVTVLDGYEISAEAIAIGKANFPEVRFYQEEFSAEGSRYDIVLLIDVLEHVPDPATLIRVVAGRANTLILHIPQQDSWNARIRNKFPEFEATLGHIHYWDARSALELLHSCDLHVVRWAFTPTFEQRYRDRRTFRSKLAYWPRRVGVLLGLTGLMAKILGGFSALAVCLPNASDAV